MEALERQNQLNERIIAEIDMMSDEALGFLEQTFERELTDFLVKSNVRYILLQQPQEQRMASLKKEISENVLSYILLKNLSVDCEKLLAEKLAWLTAGKL